MAESDLAEWSAQANEVITISLCTKAEGSHNKINSLNSFHPAWTYPIVGEQETIVGYKGLQINLLFHASDMRPHFSFSKTAEFDGSAISEVEVSDIKALFQDFLPPCMLQAPPHLSFPIPIKRLTVHSCLLYQN